MKKPSPFFIIEEFISPLQCENIRNLNFVKNSKIPHVQTIKDGQKLIINSLLDYKDEIEKRFNGVINSDIKSLFLQFPENPAIPCQSVQIDSWQLIRRKWTKIKNIDLIGLIPLKTYNSEVPIDVGFETYGSKIEFPNFNFGILPERGSLILFPSAPNFNYAISHNLLGGIEFIKIHIVLSVDSNQWEFNMENYSFSLSELAT